MHLKAPPRFLFLKSPILERPPWGLRLWARGKRHHAKVSWACGRKPFKGPRHPSQVVSCTSSHSFGTFAITRSLGRASVSIASAYDYCYVSRLRRRSRSVRSAALCQAPLSCFAATCWPEIRYIYGIHTLLRVGRSPWCSAVGTCRGGPRPVQHLGTAAPTSPLLLPIASPQLPLYPHVKAPSFV